MDVALRDRCASAVAREAAGELRMLGEPFHMLGRRPLVTERRRISGSYEQDC